MERSILPVDSTPDWDELIAVHGRRVVVALLGHGLPLERAKEVAQETWAKLMEQHARGAFAELKLPGLAITQALFFARDEARRDRRRRTAPLPEASEVLVDPGGTAETELLSREQSALALAVVQRLPQNARRVFELAYEEPGLPHLEIATRVGLSVQRVRQILCEVRKALREALEVRR